QYDDRSRSKHDEFVEASRCVRSFRGVSECHVVSFVSERSERMTGKREIIELGTKAIADHIHLAGDYGLDTPGRQHRTGSTSNLFAIRKPIRGVECRWCTASVPQDWQILTRSCHGFSLA